MGTQTQVLIGDLTGRVMAEVQAKIGPVSWQLNKAGRATLTLARTDAKTVEANLRLGNRVMIQFDNGLPAWGGTLDLPRAWTAESVECACYGLEYMLDYRMSGKDDAFYDMPVGSIFKRMIQDAQTYQSLGIELGQVWMGGGNHSPRYHFKSVFAILSESLNKMEGCDYAFLPKLEDGRISFTGELYLQRGHDKSGSVWLLEGANVSRATVDEQGPVVNRFASIASGSTWGEERSVVIEQDADSIAELGMREGSEVWSGVLYSSTLERHAINAIKTQARPRTRIAIDVVNEEPGPFRRYDIGDIVRLALPSMMFGGYDKSVRVIAREFDPGSGVCSMVVEEVTDVEPIYAGDGSEMGEIA